MSEFKGTPGGWVVDEDYDVTTSDGRVVAFTAVGVFEEEEILKNAQLIAAAPDLLEALQDVMAEQSGTEKICGHNGFTCTCPYDRAKAAINKALGQ